MKKRIVNIMIVLLILILIGALNYTVYDNKRIQKILDDYYEQGEIYKVNDCYFCGHEVLVYPVNNSWYIECDNCNIRTGYYDSKIELIEYWNNAKEEFEDER